MKNDKKFLRKSTLLLLIGCLLTLPILYDSTTIALISDSSETYDFSIEALTPSDSIEILNDTAFDLYGLPGSGSDVDPYRIENLNITTTDANGIHIFGTNMFFVIQNCYIDAGNIGIDINDIASMTAKIENNVCINNGLHGINLDNAFEVIVTNNTCTYNGEVGIYTDFADFSTFANNTCKWNNVGIYLYDTYFSFVLDNVCSENTFGGIGLEEIEGTVIINNTCNDQDSGIVVTAAEYVVIEKNRCNNIAGTGIYLVDVDSSNVTLNRLDNNEETAMYMYYCTDLIVNNNTITSSLKGITIEDNFGSNFTYNLLKDNIEYGIYVDIFCEYNTFHHNAFISNAFGLGTSQAYDVGNYSVWYDIDTNEGNYWDDYIGIGNYSIDGDGEYFVDLYPLSATTIVSELNRNLFSIFFSLLIPVIPIVLLVRKRIRK